MAHRSHRHQHAVESEGGGSNGLGVDLTRRRFLGQCCSTGFAVASAGAISSLLAACGEEGAGGSARTLRVGHLPAGCVQHLLLANKRNLFKKAGLDVQVNVFPGPAQNIQSFIAGHHDVMHNPWSNTISAYTKGQRDLRIVCGSGKGGIELVARGGSVRSVDELAQKAGTGLRLGTLRLDTLEVVAFGSLKNAGKRYEDYEMTFFPSMVGMGEALINKQLEVCSLAQPYGATVVDKAGGTYLADSNDVWGPEAADCVVTVKEDFLDQNRSKLETYLNVLEEAARQRDADYEKAIAELAPIYNADPKVLGAGLKRQVPQPVMDSRGVESLHKGVGFLVDLGYFKQDVVDEVFDGSVQPKAA